MQTLISVEDMIAAHPFLSGLEPGLCHFFTECGLLRRFGPGQQIFHEGGEADHFYFILSGVVALETEIPGDGTVRVQTLASGEALGWSWMLPPYQWHFSAKTLKPTEVISFPAVALRRNAETNVEFHAELMARIAHTLVERLQATRLQLIAANHGRSSSTSSII